MLCSLFAKKQPAGDNRMETTGRKDSTTKRVGKHHKHLTQAQRDTLDHLARHGKHSGGQMARILGVSASTVSRELRRGRVVNVDSELRERFVYSAEKGRQEACLAGSNKGPRMKLTSSLRALLDPLLADERRSPKDALAMLREQGVEGLPCFKTLYNAVHAGLMGVRMGDLPYRAHKPLKGKRMARKAHTARGNTSIEERPAHVLERLEFGHYEVDLVVGRMGTSCVLLTITERKTRVTLTVRLRRRSQRAVVAALRRLLRDGALPRLKSITCDNGGEFLDQKTLERAVRGCVYYAHPYSAFERGSNENANRIVRRFYPKGTDFGKLSRAEVAWLQQRINSIHRDVIGGLTAMQALQKELATLEAAA
jgi:transposase, IS30 family